MDGVGRNGAFSSSPAERSSSYCHARDLLRDCFQNVDDAEGLPLW